MEGERQLAEGRASVKAGEGEINQKILGAVGGNLRPGLGAGCVLDQAKGPFEAAQGADDSRCFREFVGIGQAAARRSVCWRSVGFSITLTT